MSNIKLNKHLYYCYAHYYRSALLTGNLKSICNLLCWIINYYLVNESFGEVSPVSLVNSANVMWRKVANSPKWAPTGHWGYIIRVHTLIGTDKRMTKGIVRSGQWISFEQRFELCCIWGKCSSNLKYSYSPEFERRRTRELRVASKRIERADAARVRRGHRGASVSK